MTTSVIEKIRKIPDYPKEGILFWDITTALKDAQTLNKMVDFLYMAYKDRELDYVAGIESRGFIFGAPLACKLNAGFVPIRKPNKLPAETICQSYELEYGTDSIEIHKDAIEPGKQVLILDDLLATGGTAAAACSLVLKAGGNVVSSAFVIELSDLNGRKKIENMGIEVISMLKS